MKKVNLNSTETENKDAAPLSDADLESAAGGQNFGYGIRWECGECGAHGRWSTDDNFVEMEKAGHTQRTGHTGFRIFSKRFDDPYVPFDPDLTD